MVYSMRHETKVILNEAALFHGASVIKKGMPASNYHLSAGFPMGAHSFEEGIILKCSTLYVQCCNNFGNKNVSTS